MDLGKNCVIHVQKSGTSCRHDHFEIMEKKWTALGFLRILESLTANTGMFLPRQTSKWICRKAKQNKNILEFGKKLMNGWNQQQVKSLCVSGSA